MKSIATLGAVFLLSICAFGCQMNTVKLNSSAPTVQVSAQDFVNNIEEFGYFKYVDSQNIADMKTKIAKYYTQEGGVPAIFDEDTGMTKDYRNFHCDGENVFEQDGITDMLKEFQPTFDKMNFKVKVTNHFEMWDDKNKWLNHRITINGTEYIIFQNFKGYGWGEAPMRLAEILNKELQKQHIDEQVYLIGGGNDGTLIFLNRELYKYIYGVFKDPTAKPLDVREWARVMGVKSMNLE